MVFVGLCRVHITVIVLLQTGRPWGERDRECSKWIVLARLATAGAGGGAALARVARACAGSCGKGQGRVPYHRVCSVVGQGISPHAWHRALAGTYDVFWPTEDTALVARWSFEGACR